MSYYKIFFNPRFIYLTDDPASIHEAGSRLTRIEDDKQVRAKLADLLKAGALETQILYSDHLTRLFENFKSSFQWIEAAGGIVFNKNDEILLIHRRGFWDLPKGKIDPGESSEHTAIREVQEETGLKNLVIVRKIKLFNGFQEGTLHIYPLKKNMALKLTHWFIMKTSDKELRPQAEEDIDEAKWVKPTDLKNYFPKMYLNLVELLQKSVKSVKSESQ